MKFILFEYSNEEDEQIDAENKPIDLTTNTDEKL